MTHKIFVPMDGSDCAMRALEHAVTTAKAIGDSSIHVAHAREEPDIYGEIAVYVPREKMEGLQRAQSQGVLSKAEAFLKQAGVPFETEALIGPVAQTLADRAAELGCDAIVMGTHGLSPVGKLLTGSVANKVIHFSTVPVTLVK